MRSWKKKTTPTPLSTLGPIISQSIITPIEACFILLPPILHSVDLPCQTRVVFGPPRLDPRVKKAVFMGLYYPPQPTINFTTSSILDCMSVSSYNQQ